MGCPLNGNKIFVFALGDLKVDLVVADKIVAAHGAEEHGYGYLLQRTDR